ncbi:MAG: LamG domain-containing protein [Armatimonadota bacterium]
MRAWFFSPLLMFALLGPACAAPVIYWASDPVRPGETVLVAGEGFGSAPVVSVKSGGKAVAVKPLQPTDTGLKFVIPADLKSGIFTFTIKTAEGAANRDLNRPVIWWWRGAYGEVVGAGEELRLLGRNLAAPGRKTTVTIAGKKTWTIPAKSDGYCASLRFPATPGEYRVTLNNGDADSLPVMIKATAPEIRPVPTPLNVRDFGADGTGTKDDTAAIQAALAAAAKGGGTVFLPRGRYQCTDTLRIPPKVNLIGEKREWVALFWPDFPSPPESLIRGTNNFRLSEFTVYASNHRNIIAGDLGSKPGAGNVTLTRLRVRGDAYRGHLEPAQVDERFRQSLKWSTGGGDTVQVGGENIVITDCDLYGSGRSLFLSRARHSLVANNQLYNGRWGWYCLEGSDGLIFEHNLLQGADLMSTGGGIANYSTACSRNIYYSYNEMRFCHGWDREVMTTDAGGEAYFGKVASTDGARMVLAADPHWGGRDWTNGGVFILDGKGAGQWRFVNAFDGRNVTLDRAWDRAPDASSTLGITMFHGRYAFVGNKFSDCGVFQFYGTSIECDVVGNTSERNQGFQALGLWYHGFQPSWYCQFLNNRIDEGNYYHWTNVTDGVINISGARRAEYDGPLTRGAVVRGNIVQANSHIRVNGSCQNVLVAQNEVRDAETGVFVSEACRDVLLQGNRFKNVTHEIMDEPAVRKAAQEKLARFLNRPEPILALHFDKVTGTATPDSSGNAFSARLEGGAKISDGGVAGKAAAFDGTGYLQVNEPAIFNAPDLTVDFWVKPETLRGRRGLIAKRFANAGCPFVISQMYDKIAFEATDEQGKWSLNFLSPAALKEKQWTHVAVVMKTGQGIRIFAEGKLIAEKQSALGRLDDNEPLILGREAWGGEPATTSTPGFFMGLLDEVRIWTRALTDGEIAAEHAKEVK